MIDDRNYWCDFLKKVNHIMEKLLETTTVSTSSLKNNSLKSITMEYLLSEFPSELIEGLREAADQLKRRNVYILDEIDNMEVISKFENIRKCDLPKAIQSFPNERLHDERGGSLFLRLLRKHSSRLEGKEKFAEALAELRIHENTDTPVVWEWTYQVPAELITELYTTILGPDNLIEDINEVDMPFIVCFEDDAAWSYFEKTIKVS